MAKFGTDTPARLVVYNDSVTDVIHMVVIKLLSSAVCMLWKIVNDPK